MFAVVYAKVIIKMETSKKTSTEIVKNYMRYLKLERNFSVNTLEAYRHDLDYLLSYVAQTEREFIRQRQADGIAAAKAQGVRLGRPPLAQPKEFPAVHQAWLKKEISAREAARRLSVTHKTFLRWAHKL